MRSLFLFTLLVLLPISGSSQLAVPTSNLATGTGKSSSNRFTLSSSIGQTVVGSATSTDFTAAGGFGNYDRFNPTAICMNITVTLQNGQATITAMNLDGGSADNVGIADLQISQTTFDENDVGQNTIELTVTDFIGLTDTCSAVVNVVTDVIETKSFWILN